MQDEGNNDDRDLARIFEEANPKTIAHVSKEQLGQTGEGEREVKAVLFLPEGADLNDALNIEVVGISATTMAAMAARRC